MATLGRYCATELLWYSAHSRGKHKLSTPCPIASDNTSKTLPKTGPCVVLPQTTKCASFTRVGITGKCLLSSVLLLMNFSVSEFQHNLQPSRLRYGQEQRACVRPTCGINLSESGVHNDLHIERGTAGSEAIRSWYRSTRSSIVTARSANFFPLPIAKCPIAVSQFPLTIALI